MQWFRLRPTFEIPLAESVETAKDKLQQEFKRVANTDLFLMYGEYGELHLPAAEHRLWSPHLTFYVHQSGNSRTIFGRFAPRPNVWTSVWIAYLLMAFTAFFGLTIACSQWMVKHHPWGLWIMLVALFLIIAINLLAHIGQQLSVDQMYYLRGELDGILARAGVKTGLEVVSNTSKSSLTLEEIAT